jgi:SAM-dependent methyltransferase
VRSMASLGQSALRVLEIGCGGGAQLWYLAVEGHQPVGLDFAPHALEQAAQLLEKRRVRAPLVLGEVGAIPFEAESFDLVLDVQTLSHLHDEDLPVAWREVASVLRPGGHFLSMGFTVETYGWTSGRRIGARTVVDIPDGPFADVGQVNFCTEDTTVGLGASAGIEAVQAQHQSRTVGSQRLNIAELVYLGRKATRSA